MLTSRGFSCEPNEVEFKDCETELGMRDYTADIVATLKVIVEIDGKTHWSKNAIHKDEVRDLYFKTKNIPTLRLPQDVRYTDDLFLKELLYQIWGINIA